MQYSLSYKRKFTITIGENTIPVTQNCVAVISKCSTTVADTTWRSLLMSYIAQIANCDLSDSTIVWNTANASQTYYNFVKTDDNSSEKVITSPYYKADVNITAKKYHSVVGSNPKFMSFRTKATASEMASNIPPLMKQMVSTDASYDVMKEYVIITTLIDIL